MPALVESDSEDEAPAHAVLEESDDEDTFPATLVPEQNAEWLRTAYERELDWSLGGADVVSQIWAEEKFHEVLAAAMAVAAPKPKAKKKPKKKAKAKKIAPPPVGVWEELGEEDRPWVRAFVYDMKKYFENVCKTYLHYAPKGTAWSKAPTPFRKERDGPQNASAHEGEYLECPWCVSRFAESEFTRGHTSDPKRVTKGTPLCAPIPLVPGHFAPVAAKLLMMVLYGARYARRDLLRCVCVI